MTDVKKTAGDSRNKTTGRQDLALVNFCENESAEVCRRKVIIAALDWYGEMSNMFASVEKGLFQSHVTEVRDFRG